MTDAVEIVSDLVKIPSVSPFGRNETERRERFERCREVLAYLEEFLQKQGAQTEQLVFEGGHDKWWYPVPNLYAELTIGDRKAAGHKFLCYMGHIDVVPVGEEKLWRRPPFSGQVDEGFVWGRGATDMKGSVGAWMSALEKLKAGKGDGGIFAGVFENGQIVGMGGIVRKSDREAEVCKLHVRKEFKGRGYGEKLLNYLERMARRKGFEKLRLHVTTSQRPAINLYRKQAFLPTGNEVYMTEIEGKAYEYDTLYMEKLIV